MRRSTCSARWPELDPADLEVRAGLALAYVARGDLDKARTYLSAETAGTNPALWLTLAEMELRGGPLRRRQGRRSCRR